MRNERPVLVPRPRARALRRALLLVVVPAVCGACGGSGGAVTPPTSVGFTLGPVTTIPVLSVFTPPHTLLDTELGDHDLDGTLDLAWIFATTYANDPSFDTQSLRGAGDGTFPGSYGGVWHRADAVPLLTTGDLLGVGVGGFVRAWNNGGPLQVSVFGWRNDAAGTHGIGGSDDVTGTLAGLASGDWDGDQIDDVVIADAAGARVVAWRSLGESGLAPGPQSTLLPGGVVPTGLAAGRIDADAREDVVVAAGLSGYVVLASLGGGLFATGPVVPLGAGRTFAEFVAGDFNGDGRQDVAGVVVQPGQPNSLGVLLGHGNGLFDALIPTALDAALGGTALLHVHRGDLNGDGRDDLAFVAPALDRAVVAFADGAGGFTLATDPDLVGGGNATLGLGDVDGDGDLDLAVGNATALTVRVLLNDLR